MGRYLYIADSSQVGLIHDNVSWINEYIHFDIRTWNHYQSSHNKIDILVAYQVQ